MNRSNLFFLILLLASFGFSEDPLQEWLIKAERFRKDYPQEKIHLHTDKTTYLAGDTIWFKSYLVNAENNELSALSGNVDVALVNERNQVVRTLKTGVPFGLGSGNMAIPDSLASGQYTLYAYTNWMRNFGETFFFRKTLNILNSDAPVASNGKSGGKSGMLDVQFFPEGGWMVNGLRTKVGFKVVGEDGLGRAAQGRIVDQDGKHVASFQTDYAGMGVFAFQPQFGKKYIAVLKSDDGSEQQFKLPAAKESGYVLNVNPYGDAISVRISATPGLSGTEPTLVVHRNGVVAYMAKTKLEGGRVTTRIPRTRFNTGILKFSLLSPDASVVSERLIFTNHGDQLRIEAEVAKGQFKPGEKVTIDLNASDDTGMPVPGSFSVAVTADEVASHEEKEITILSNLLLTSDLKGYIETPNYYFLDVDSAKVRQLDHLLLTQGWRRFNPDQTLKPVENLPFKAEKGLSLSGMVQTMSGKPAADAKVKLFTSTKSGVFFNEATAGADGRFTFNDLPFSDSVMVRLQASTQKGNRDLKIIADSVSESLPALLHTPDPHLAIPGGLQAPTNATRSTTPLGNALKNGIALKEVKVKSRAVDPVAFRQQFADKVLKGDLLTKTSPSLTIAISAHIPGVYFDPEGKPFYKSKRYYQKGAMQVWVNGLKADDLFLNSLSPDDVESVELLASTNNLNMYSSYAGGGGDRFQPFRGGDDGAILMVYTRQRRFVVGSSPGTAMWKMAGIQNPSEFYSAKFDVKDRKSDPVVPRTVFWSPGVTTNETGKAHIEFDAPRQEGNYKVVLEGTDGKGTFGRKVFHYRVAR